LGADSVTGRKQWKPEIKFTTTPTASKKDHRKDINTLQQHQVRQRKITVKITTAPSYWGDDRN